MAQRTRDLTAFRTQAFLFEEVHKHVDLYRSKKASFVDGIVNVLHVSQVTFTRLPPVDLPHTLEEVLPDGETHEMPHVRIRLDHRNN